MISRRTKELYYWFASPLMWLNAQAYKAFRQPSGSLSVHLGPGQSNYIPNWVNVDANILTARIDLWANLADGVPFRSSSLKRIYSFHVIEHLPDLFLVDHAKELFRVLDSGGAVRIGGPDIENACRKFVEGDAKWFSDFPDCRQSVGGRFANFVFCRNEHLTALSFSYLQEVFQSVGFTSIVKCIPAKTSHYCFEDVLSFEHESDFACPHSIVIEARKP